VWLDILKTNVFLTFNNSSQSVATNLAETCTVISSASTADSIFFLIDIFVT
jgi:hypothetical protein